MTDTHETMEKILEESSRATLAIRSDGPPTYRGERPYRIVLEGDPAGFRMLSRILELMADTVEARSSHDGFGWHLVLDSEAIPQLTLAEQHMLALTCDPASRSTAPATA